MKKARSPLRGYVTTICFWALMNEGLLNELESGTSISLNQFADKQQLNEKILFYICQYLHRIGYLSLNNDRIKLTSKGLSFWRDVYGVFHLFSAYEPLFSSLSAQLHNKVTFGNNLLRREDEVALGFAELGHAFLFKLMACIIEKEGFHSIVDLGCAEVELSAFLCQRGPQYRCLGIDHSPAVIAKAKQRISRMDLDDRIQVIQGDIFEIDKLRYDFSPYQLVTAIDLFHAYFPEGEEKLIELFKKLRMVFSRHSFLFSEICLPPHKQMKRIAYPYAEHELFHDLTWQKSFARDELVSLLERAGFQIKKQWNFNKLAGRICLLL